MFFCIIPLTFAGSQHFSAMKSHFSLHRLSLFLLAGAGCLCLNLTACRTDPKPLKIFGEWQEKEYSRYDSTTHSQYRLIIDCVREIQDTCKSGDFQLYINAFHAPSLQDDHSYAYMEFVQGEYFMNEDRKTIRFEGQYYTDSSFTTLATKENWPYSVGNYHSVSDYRLNDLYLTLSLDDSTRRDINTFYPIQIKEECY